MLNFHKKNKFKIMKTTRQMGQDKYLLGESTPLARENSFDPTPLPTVSAGFTGVSSASYKYKHTHNCTVN